MDGDSNVFAGTFRVPKAPLCCVSSQLCGEVRVAGLHVAEGTGAQRGQVGELRLLKGLLVPNKAGCGKVGMRTQEEGLCFLGLLPGVLTVSAI